MTHTMTVARVALVAIFAEPSTALAAQDAQGAFEGPSAYPSDSGEA